MIHIDIYELYTLIVLDWIESDEYFYTLVWMLVSRWTPNNRTGFLMAFTLCQDDHK